MLLEGSELTKEDRESQLYDEFEHFKQHKEESINDYYVMFSKLITDMRNIKMTMPKLQLNSKFVNNMLPEWGRFVTAVKLNRGLRESNYDQLFTYLNQHEAHAKENKMVLERLAQPTAQPTADPLALLSNVSNAQHGLPSSSTSSITPLTPPRANSTDDLIENLTSTLSLLTQSYRTFLPQTNNQLRTSSNLRNQATVQNGRVVVQNVQGHIVRNCPQPKRPQNSEYFKDKMLLMQAQENRVALDAEQLFFLAGEPPTAQTMFMANLSSADPITDEAGPSFDSDILSELQDHDQYLDDSCAYQEEHVMHGSFELTGREQEINEQLRLVISDRNLKEELKRELHSTKLQLTSTINRNKSMVEETTFLKQNFKQKENKLLADFLNMKSLKEKVEDRLVKQDQSLQTVYMLCRPRPLYNDLNKVAIGYKNPLCLTRAKQAQPALYNGHEILKDNHARAKVYNSEDTLEIAELTRKKMNAKMTDPECVTHKVKIAPHDYSKENLLAIFTPQKQLTPKQIYWSNDLIKLKSKALKERAKVSRPIKAFTVYPLNTPTTLVPRVLPTTSQVKIHIFTLIQQFLEFDKTCKKRITPSAITDGERGFEQTKECYLQEVILFFQTIKDNFEGIQKAQTREVKQMKDVFEDLEAEVAQCAVNRKHDAIDLKNILIANDNLIAECLSKEVFSVSTKSELNVARFAEIHVANTSVEARCLALEVELDTLRNKSHQRIKGNKDTPDFDSVFVIGKMQASLQGKDYVIRQLKKQISQLQVTNSDTECTVKVRTTDSQHTKHIEQVTKLTAKNVTLRTSISKAKVQPPALTRTKHAVDVEPIVPRLRNNREAHLDYLRHLKESVETIRDIVEEAKVVRPLDRSIVSACRYTQHSQELLEYAIGTYPPGSQPRAKQLAYTPLIRKKQVTAIKPSDRLNSNKNKMS
nr:hypothetical protein [Tanacetum cinerariifolium]